MEQILKMGLGVEEIFAINLKDYLISQGHKVVHNLDDNDIDIILITEPRKNFLILSIQSSRCNEIFKVCKL